MSPTGPAAADAPAASAPARGRSRQALALVGLLLGSGVGAGLVWFLLAPRTVGVRSGDGVSFPGHDDPIGVLSAVYLAVTAVAGLLVGVVAVGLGERRVVTRSIMLTAGGLPAALVAYAVGAWLGPPAVAVQVAADADPVLVPLRLSTPLLALLWPASTALLVTAALLVWLIVNPWPSPGSSDADGPQFEPAMPPAPVRSPDPIESD